MVNRYLPGKSRWLLITAVAAISVGCLTATRAAAAGKVEKLGTSLNLVPEDAAFYVTMLRNREQYDAIAKSNAVKRVMEMPMVKMGLMLYNMQANNPELPVGQFHAALKDPEVKKVVDLLIDMVSDEVFFYGDQDFAGFMALIQEVNAANQTAPLTALLGGNMNPGAAQGGAILNALAQNIDKVKIPEMVIGFKTDKTKTATEQLGNLEKVIKAAIREVPELRGRFQRTKIAGHDYLVLSLDGSMIPWDEIPIDEIEEIESEEGSTRRLFNHLKRETLVVALGVHDDYVLISIGATTGALEKLGKGKALVSRPEFKPLEKYANKRLASIGYASEAFNKQAGSQQIQFDNLLNALDKALPGAKLSKKDADQIRKDAAALAEDVKGLFPEPGAAMSFNFLTRQGIEGYGHNWTKDTQYDGSKPLGLLKHVGGSPAMAMVARGKNSPEQYDLFVKWLKVGFGYFEKYGPPKMEPEVRTQYNKAMKLATPLLKRIDNANRKMLIPALEDGQFAFVMDTKLTSKQFIKQVPATEDPMPMVEPAFVVGISDAKLMRQACDEYQKVFDGVLEMIREMAPDAIPEDYKIPRPKESKTDAGEIYTYAAPKEWGLDKKIALTLGLSDNVAVIASSKKHAQRLMTSMPLRVGGVLKNPKRPLAMAGFFDWAGLVTAAQPWIDLALAQAEPGSEDEAAAITSQVQTVVDVLKVFRTVTGESYFEDGALVTHTLVEIRDLEPKKE